MPTYTLKAKDGNEYDFDAPSEANAHEALRWMEKQMSSAPKSSPKSEAKLADDRLRKGAREALDQESGTLQFGPLDTGIPLGGLERPLINLGAGFDSFYQGAKGLFQKDSPERDARVRTKRTLDQEAADSMTGGGAIQTVGEMLPGFVVPVGGYVNAAKGAAVGATNLARAAVGAEKLASTAVRARPTTMAATADAVIGGGVGGLLQERTSQDSAVMDAVIGAAGASVLPRLLHGGKKVVDLFRSADVAEREAGARLVKALGGEAEAQAAIDAIKGYKPHAFAKDIPLTTAEVTQSPALRTLENASQAKQTADWVPFREQQASSRWKALQDATSEADNLGAHLTARDDATAPIRERALRRAASDDFFTAPVAQKIDSLMRGDLRPNKSVKSIANYVGGELDQGVTPGQLYTVRKTLTDKLNGKVAITDELGNAIKGERAAVMQLVKSIDQGLDDASKGAWSKYLAKYQSKSGEVSNARASEKMRELFETGPLTNTAADQVPALTSDRLRKATEKFGPNDYGGNNFNYGTQDALKGLQENLDRTFALGKTVRSVGTGGGGSNTAMDNAAIAAAFGKGFLEKMTPDMLKPAVRLALQRGADDKAIQAALQDPQKFIAVVSRKLRAGSPLTKGEEIFALALRQSAIAPAASQL